MLIEVNGIQINYELLSKADAPVVMLSHSLALQYGNVESTTGRFTTPFSGSSLRHARAW